VLSGSLLRLASIRVPGSQAEGESTPDIVDISSAKVLAWFDKETQHKPYIKLRTAPINLVLGEDVQLNEIVSVSEMALVGSFLGR